MKSDRAGYNLPALRAAIFYFQRPAEHACIDGKVRSADAG
jgi:hypothetical protein